MKKRIFIIVITFFCCNTLLSVLPSCKRKKRVVTPCTTSCFSISSASVYFYDAANHIEFQNSPYSVKATDLVFRVSFNGSTSVCYKPQASQEMNWSLFSTAKADMIAPTCPVNYGSDSIVAYNIYSNKSYDGAHPAGSSLNDIITTDDIPLQPINSENSNSFLCSFNVDAAPTDTGTHIFTIEIAQKDGDTITVNTPAIKLLK